MSCTLPLGPETLRKPAFNVTVVPPLTMQLPGRTLVRNHWDLVLFNQCLPRPNHEESSRVSLSRGSPEYNGQTTLGMTGARADLGGLNTNV